MTSIKLSVCFSVGFLICSDSRSEAQDGVDAMLRIYARAFAKAPEDKRIKPVTREEFLKGVQKCLDKDPPKSARAKEELQKLVDEFKVPVPCTFDVKTEWIEGRTKYTGCRIVYCVGLGPKVRATVPIRREVVKSRKLMQDEIEKAAKQ